ncbi:MAG: hypothetical protein ACRD2T_15810 [Thermoanaerobaculia bacterium]
MRITACGGASGVWAAPGSTRWRMTGAPQKAMVPSLAAVVASDRVTVSPASAPRSTARRSQRCGVVTEWVTSAVSSSPRRAATRKVTGSSSGVPTARSSSGRDGRVTRKRTVSGERVTRVSRKTSRSPCQLTPEGTLSRCSRRKTSLTDSIANSAPAASLGRISRWRMREPETGAGGVMV